MKFRDQIMAATSVVLFTLLLDFVLKGALIPLNSPMVEMLAWALSCLVAPIFVGYVFALKIYEDGRVKTIGSVVVLSSFALMLFLVAWFANPLASPWIKEQLVRLFDTNDWTNYVWSAFSALAIGLDVVIALVLSFIGLYIGSMLRKPEEQRERLTREVGKTV